MHKTLVHRFKNRFELKREITRTSERRSRSTLSNAQYSNDLLPLGAVRFQRAVAMHPHNLTRVYQRSCGWRRITSLLRHSYFIPSPKRITPNIGDTKSEPLISVQVGPPPFARDCCAVSYQITTIPPVCIPGTSVVCGPGSFVCTSTSRRWSRGGEMYSVTGCDRTTFLRCNVVASDELSARPSRRPYFRSFVAIPECIYKLPHGPYIPPYRASLSFQGWLLPQPTELSRTSILKSTPSKSGGWSHHSCSSSEPPTTAQLR